MEPLGIVRPTRVATAADEAVGARRDLSWSQGGIMPLSPEMAAAGATTRWQPYFEVADCDAAAAAVTAKGRTVVVPASDVPGVGRFAVALDPDGAQFAVIASVPA
jgi:predicted enzyme related to lactoylglutathione lyase